MSHLPEPVESIKVQTDYGVVQLYKFQGSDTPHKTPLPPLPGKGSATPMWEANLSGFLEHRPVYTLDLIGEPGLSTETRRIETARTKRMVSASAGSVAGIRDPPIRAFVRRVECGECGAQAS